MIGILSDAHGNYYAFKRAISILRELGVDEIIFLGDSVGYIPSIKVVESLMDMSNLKFCVLGNHEDMLLRESIDKERDKIYQLCKIKLLMSDVSIDFISSWKRSRTLHTQAGKLLFVHGSPNNPTFGYVYPDSDLSVFNTDAKFVFLGNSHYPFINKYKKTTYVNVGSCGLPRDDGRYGSVALFDPETGKARIIRFDIIASTAKTIAEISGIHGSVTDLFNRKKKELFGEIYD